MPMARSRQACRRADYLALTDDGGGFRTHMADDAAGFHSHAADVPGEIPLRRNAVGAERGDVAGRGDACRAGVFGRCCSAPSLLLWLRSAGALALAPVLAAVLIVAEFRLCARSNTPDLLARRCCSAGSTPMSGGARWRPRILLLLAVHGAAGQRHLRRRVRRAAAGVPADGAWARWPAPPPPSPPISRSRTGPGIPAGGRISISRASSSR